MYRVEKFFPPECPKCQKKFLKENRDWTTLLGYLERGEKKMIKGFPVIICAKCDNYTIIIFEKTYQVSDPKVARRLLKKGFVNLKKVRAFGNMTRDTIVGFDGRIKYL